MNSLGVESLDGDLGVADDIDHIRSRKPFIITILLLLLCDSRYRVLRDPIMKALHERASEPVPPVFFQHGQAAELVVRPLCRCKG